MSKREAAATLTSPRTIRIFVSSTLKDMPEERAVLSQRVFPQLRQLCESRGVAWNVVDLRGGLDESEQTESRLLPISLAEIERCRPFFLSLLGESYGCIPDQIPASLLAAQPWLQDYPDRSITELEIIHGAFNHGGPHVSLKPRVDVEAFFYFRGPAYLDRLSPEQRLAFEERPSADEIALLGQAEAEQRAAERRLKLAALKERIRKSKLPLRRDYPDPEHFGEMALSDLSTAIERLYPADAIPSALAREALEHAAAALNYTARANNGGSLAEHYIARQSYFDVLDRHAEGSGPPLIVLGEAGAGKSALLANWALRYRDAKLAEQAANHKPFWRRLVRLAGDTGAESPCPLVMHFIGTNPYLVDRDALMRRLLGELQLRYGVEQEPPKQAEDLPSALAEQLRQAAGEDRLVVVIDGLDHLLDNEKLTDDGENPTDLSWLPSEIPENIRLIVSVGPGRSQKDLEDRGWRSLHVEPLTVDERRRLIKSYVEHHKNPIAAERIERIADASQTANPMFLRALLVVLRLYGSEEMLDHEIDVCLENATVEALYGRVLACFEKDHDGGRPCLVRDTLTLLWAARRGLTEGELLDLLGAPGEPLRSEIWSPFYLELGEFLSLRGGLIGLYHESFQRVVEDRYLADPKEQRATHLLLADYFQARVVSPRRVDELPWQLAEAESWPRLYALFGDLEFFSLAWKTNSFDVKEHWALIEESSDLGMLAAYQSVLEDPQRYDAELVWNVAMLIADTNHLDEAVALEQWLIERFRQNGDLARLQTSLANQAQIYLSRGDLDGALALFKEQESVCRQLSNSDGLVSAIGSQALILAERGNLDRALALWDEQAQLCRDLGKSIELAFALGNRANALKTRGNLDSSLVLLEEQESVLRELDKQDGLATCLGHQAAIHKERGDLERANSLHTEEERLFREVGNRAGLATSLFNQAMILLERKDLSRAWSKCKEQESIYRELGARPELARCLGMQATIMLAHDDLDEALVVYRNQERLWRELGAMHEIAVCLGKQALILKERGDLDGAMSSFKGQERIYRVLRHKDGLAFALDNQANILEKLGDVDGAMALYKAEEKLCRELKNKAGLQASLGNQARVIKAQGNSAIAIALYQEQERICREIGHKLALAHNLGQQAAIIFAQRDLNEALRLLKEQERLCRELENPEELAATLAEQSRVLVALGELEKALVLRKEEEKVYRELNNDHKLQASLGHQAAIHYECGDMDRVEALAEEQERICRRLGHQRGLAMALGLRGMVLRANGDHDGATALHQQEDEICRELGYQEELATSLNNQGLLLSARADLVGAMARHEEAERIYRFLDHREGLLRSLGHQAAILRAHDDFGRAVTVYQEQARLCRELKKWEGLTKALSSEAAMLAQLKERIQALAAADQAVRVATEHGLHELASQAQKLRDSLR